MKKILNIIILFAAVVFCGCSDFDDSELRGRIDGYKNRIEALKAKAETLGKQLGPELSDQRQRHHHRVAGRRREIRRHLQGQQGRRTYGRAGDDGRHRRRADHRREARRERRLLLDQVHRRRNHVADRRRRGEVPRERLHADDFGRCRRLLDRGRRADTRRFGQSDQGHDRRHVGIPLGGAGRRRQFQPNARRRKHDHPAGFQLAQPQAGRDAGYHRRRPFEEHYGILRAFGRG